jgi:putative ABC transport system permease protein
VLWATAIAIPLAEVFGRRWLNGFAYHVNVEVSTLVAAAMITWAIACATVLVHVLRAARAPAMQALRYQ